MTYKIQIDDLVRDATADEIAQIESREAEAVAVAQAQAARQVAKDAVLAKLELTADEISALLS
jgi:hypothetical protein